MLRAHHKIASIQTNFGMTDKRFPAIVTTFGLTATPTTNKSVGKHAILVECMRFLFICWVCEKNL